MVVALAAPAVGCGGGSGSGDTQSGSASVTKIRGPQPPKDASPPLVAFYRNFQPPLPNPAIQGSAAAITAGKRACRSKTPLEVKREFIGQSKLTPGQRKAVAKLAQYDREPTADYPAGQLAALVYEGTLKQPIASEGFRGCIYALALRVKKELMPKQTKSGTGEGGKSGGNGENGAGG